MSKEKTKRVNIDYYAVVMKNGGSFKGLLERIGKMPNTQVRNYEIRGEFPTRLDMLESRQVDGSSLLSGEMIKIRMTGLPVKARITGEKSEINFDYNEGVGEETWFLYDPDGDYLLLQRNRDGVSARAFEDYFSYFSKGGVELQPLIGAGALMKLMAASRISTMEVAVRPVMTSRDELAKTGAAVAGAIAALDEVGGSVVFLQVGVGRGSLSRSLSLNSVVRLVRSLLKRSSEHGDVKKLKATAMYDDEIGLDPIDFLKDRLGVWDNIPYDESRRLREQSITGLLEKAWRLEDFQTLRQNERDRRD